MAERTSISWTDATFNPWIGCTKVGPGCDHCYAETLMDTRYQRVQWGAGNPRSRTSAETWKHPSAWNKNPFFECLGCGRRFGVTRKTPEGPLHCPGCGGDQMKAARRRVFCASLADVFDNEVDPRWRQDLFDLILATPNLDWLLLTKRIGNARKMLNDLSTTRGALLTSNDEYRPPSNVWLGATVVNQEEADRDIPKLLAIPAAVRFLSIEPMLGRVDLCETFGMWWNQTMQCFEGTGPGPFSRNRVSHGASVLPGGVITPERGIDWVIAGGESGPNARPMHPDWPRSLRDQCAAAGVPFLFKQWGEHLPCEAEVRDDGPGQYVYAIDGCGEIPEGRHKIINAHDQDFVRIGKTAAGNLLDGKVHEAWPR